MESCVRLNKAYSSITGTYERLINTWNSFRPETQELILELTKVNILRWISFDIQVVEIESTEPPEIEDDDEYGARLLEELRQSHTELKVPQRKCRKRYSTLWSEEGTTVNGTSCE